MGKAGAMLSLKIYVHFAVARVVSDVGDSLSQLRSVFDEAPAPCSSVTVPVGIIKELGVGLSSTIRFVELADHDGLGDTIIFVVVLVRGRKHQVEKEERTGKDCHAKIWNQETITMVFISGKARIVLEKII